MEKKALTQSPGPSLPLRHLPAGMFVSRGFPTLSQSSSSPSPGTTAVTWPRPTSSCRNGRGSFPRKPWNFLITSMPTSLSGLGPWSAWRGSGKRVWKRKEGGGGGGGLFCRTVGLGSPQKLKVVIHVCEVSCGCGHSDSAD